MFADTNLDSQTPPTYHDGGMPIADQPASIPKPEVKIADQFPQDGLCAERALADLRCAPAGAELRKANWLAEFLFQSIGHRATIHATEFWFLTMIPGPHNFNHELRTFHKLTIVNKSSR